MSSSIGQNPTLLSSTCDGILSWMIEIWMKCNLINDSDCNIVILGSPKKLQGVINNVMLTFSVGDTIP